jgi:preprotein translocase subunit SecA
MAERPQHAGSAHRYDRDGLYRWAKQRFAGAADSMSEEDFRTQSRARIHDMMLETSRKFYPSVGQEAIDEKLEEVFEGTELSEAEDAHDLAEWMRATWGLDVDEKQLTGVSRDTARGILWNAFDDRYRPEMHRMERGLVLGILDASWKNHLYTMDHLRSGIGLVGYAQVDPKTEYKRQGMKEFDSMWEGVQNKVTDTVFRMEEEEGFNEALWEIGATIHESAPRLQAQANGQMTTNAGGEGKKPEPIRRHGERVGRNDPCPCGSGKKYKNCHMRQGVA